MTTQQVAERRIVLLIGAIQFVNILDFMMVMPLGPDFANDLGIPNAALGIIGGSYTGAAAVSGIVGSLFLDRFDRRKALSLAMLGLVIGTAAGGFATGLKSLVAARIVAGAFGGPATSISLAIIADSVAIERRGRAMGAVMSSFAVASVLGVPAGLELARLGGWQTPFFGVAALGLLVTASALFVMPPMTIHLKQSDAPILETSRMGFLLRLPVAMCLLSMGLIMLGNFAIVPNLSAYVQINLGYPREQLGMLYLVGGVVSFATMRVAGRWVDRAGPFPVALAGTAVYALNLYVGFIRPVLMVPIMVVFALLMVTSSFRMVPMQALATRVPEPRERARYMSAQSAVQHIACSVGSMLGAAMLVTAPDGRLIGMPAVATFAAVVAMLVPGLVWFVDQRVRAPATVTPAMQPR